MDLGKGVFVTGTDTGVGKTVVAASIAGALRRSGHNIGVMKPFQTGALKTETGWYAPDAEFLKSVAGVTDEIDLICPVILEAPLAPSVAAKLAGATTGIAAVKPAFDELTRRHELVIVEGAGGLGVPINGHETMRDLASMLALPVLIVARPGLGTINHTLLTVEYARAAGLTVAGIIISNFPDHPDLAEQTNPEAIEASTGIPVLGLVLHDSLVDTENSLSGRIVENMLENPLLSNLTQRLGDIASGLGAQAR